MISVDGSFRKRVGSARCGVRRIPFDKPFGSLRSPPRALPTETKVESGTSQSKSRTSVNLSESGLPRLPFPLRLDPPRSRSRQQCSRGTSRGREHPRWPESSTTPALPSRTFRLSQLPLKARVLSQSGGLGPPSLKGKLTDDLR